MDMSLRSCLPAHSIGKNLKLFPDSHFISDSDIWLSIPSGPLTKLALCSIPRDTGKQPGTVVVPELKITGDKLSHDPKMHSSQDITTAQALDTFWWLWFPLRTQKTQREERRKGGGEKGETKKCLCRECVCYMFVYVWDVYMVCVVHVYIGSVCNVWAGVMWCICGVPSSKPAAACEVLQCLIPWLQLHLPGSFLLYGLTWLGLI